MIANKIVGPDRLDHVLKQSSVIVVAVPETPATRKLIGEREIALMRPDAILCNISRGSVVDERALKQAMQKGRLRAAILDVMEEEPLTPHNELWDIPQTYISPHCAGSHEGYAETFVQLFASNVLRYTAGQTLLNRVDPEQRY
jgi:phosphoglycerate dehydrogenase-like enzyme